MQKAPGSDKFSSDLLAAQQKQMDQALTAAHQEQQLAQQLRIDAENVAEEMIASAADRVREKESDAASYLDLVYLEASYIGAEQVLHGKADDDVSLKFDARIECEAGDFGETAIATPVDKRIAVREVRNLATCYPHSLTRAGETIGKVGRWSVAFFKRK